MPVVDDAVEEVVNGDIRIMPANKLSHTLTVQSLYDNLSLQVNKQEILIIIASFGDLAFVYMDVIDD